MKTNPRKYNSSTKNKRIGRKKVWKRLDKSETQSRDNSYSHNKNREVDELQTRKGIRNNSFTDSRGKSRLGDRKKMTNLHQDALYHLNNSNLENTTQLSYKHLSKDPSQINPFQKQQSVFKNKFINQKYEDYKNRDNKDTFLKKLDKIWETSGKNVHLEAKYSPM